MFGYLCVQSLPEWAWMFMIVLERQRAILEDGYLTHKIENGVLHNGQQPGSDVNSWEELWITFQLLLLNVVVTTRTNEKVGILLLHTGM